MGRLGAAVILIAMLTGCGYVGEPLPPSLKLPSPVRDLTARQRGDKFVLEFTCPEVTTEDLPLKNPPRLELRIGTGSTPFRSDDWAAQARVFDTLPNQDKLVHFETPASEWVGKEVLLSVQAFGPTGRSAGWSNFVVITVVPPLVSPEGVRVENTRKGLLVRWSGNAPAFRVLRKMEDGTPAIQAARVQAMEWLDTAVEWEGRYKYTVQAIAPAGAKEAESELSAEVESVREDRFPPSVPAGLTAVISTDSIELSWDRSPEEDLAAYRVYRATGDGKWELAVDSALNPTFSDTKLESGKAYRYAVSSVDRIGNESDKSAPVEVKAP